MACASGDSRRSKQEAGAVARCEPDLDPVVIALGGSNDAVGSGREDEPGTKGVVGVACCDTLLFTDIAAAMTIGDDAREAFNELDLDREDLLLAAKSVAQSIIDDSRESDEPLSGMLYDVWGLYNDGMPKCRWTAPYENEDIVFSGQFRVAGSDAFVVRRKVITRDDLIDLLRELNGNGIRIKR